MYKLLVVDDETETRDTLCSCFPWEEVGFQVEARASDGMEALQYLLQNPGIHVVLCDIRMPGMNGIQLSREIRERKLDIHTVLLSGYRDFEYAREAINCGVRQYLLKPAKFREIHALFSELSRQLTEASGGPPPAADPVRQWADETLNNSGHPVIRNIVEHVLKHYRTTNLDDIAGQVVHMNPTYVSAYFKKMTGMNFSEFVQSVKMKKAADLLKDPRWKSFEVSEMVGYANVKNFIRTFKTYYGKTPGQFRNEESQ